MKTNYDPYYPDSYHRADHENEPSQPDVDWDSIKGDIDYHEQHEEE